MAAKRHRLFLYANEVLLRRGGDGAPIKPRKLYLGRTQILRSLADISLDTPSCSE